MPTPIRLIVREHNGNVQVMLHRPEHIIQETNGEAVALTSPLSVEEREQLRWYLEDYLQAPEVQLDGQHYRRAAPQGFLLFEDAAGGEELISAEDLTAMLQDAKVPVFVLNACRSGTLTSDAAPEAAVATRMLCDGAAAVVAMSSSVYAVAAAEFMAVLYEELFRGRSVAAAVSAGRRQMRRANLRPSPKGNLPLQDWLVPIHYGRRQVSFPHLAAAKRDSDRPLADILTEMRATTPKAELPEGVHAQGDLAQVGSFVGRDEQMLELERAIRQQHVVVIHGMGGSGKTELAKAFARWLQISGGLDRQALFHSFEPGVATFGLDGVVGSVGLQLFGPQFLMALPSLPERRQAVLQALSRHRLLLLWDNFETVHSMPSETTPPLDEAQRQLVQDFLAEVGRSGQCGVVITSRSEEPWLGPAAHRLALGGLRREEAILLADELTAGHACASARRQSRAFAELLEWLGGHPLSLRLVLRHLITTDAQALLEALRGQRPLPGQGASTGRTGSLDACVGYSFEHLPDAHRQRLPALSLFEQVVDEDVLTLISKQETAPARFRGLDKSAWTETLERCTAVGLVSSLGMGMYRLHPALPSYLTSLWRREAGDDWDAELASAREARLQAYATFGRWLTQQMEGGKAEVAMAVLRAQRRTMGRVASQGLAQGRFDEVQDLLQPLNDYWNASGLWEEARGWVERCRTATETLDGTAPDLDTEAGALWLFVASSQSIRLIHAGQLDGAMQEYDAIRRALEGSGSDKAKKRLAITYHSLGVVAQKRGKLDDAHNWYQKSLEIDEALGNRRGMASSYHQLGNVAQLRGKLDDAHNWFQKSLEIFQPLGNRPGMASSYHQLGMVAQERGKLDDAHNWYQKSLEIEVALGDRPGMALTYGQLGLLSELRQQPAEALEWTVRCVSLFSFGHPATGPGPRYLLKLTVEQGIDKLEATWQRATGESLPDEWRAAALAAIAEQAE